MELYEPLMRELGCIPSTSLGRERNDSKVWVAGVKVSSQTPAIRSGQRIIFITLDDMTGPLDVTFFERVQPWCARTVFHSWILLVQGVLRKRGGASRRHRTDPSNVALTIVGEEAFDLVEVGRDRAAGHSIQMCLGLQRKKRSQGILPQNNPPGGRLWHSSGGSAGR
jgi:error-prone DNA polymerase